MATWTSSPPCADRLKVPRGGLFGPVRSLHVSVGRDRTPSEFLAGPSARRVRDLVTLVSSKFPAGNFWMSPLYKRFRLVVLERPRHARVGAVHRESGPCSFEIVRKFPAGNFGSADLTGRAVTPRICRPPKVPRGEPLCESDGGNLDGPPPAVRRLAWRLMERCWLLIVCRIRQMRDLTPMYRGRPVISQSCEGTRAESSPRGTFRQNRPNCGQSALRAVDSWHALNFDRREAPRREKWLPTPMVPFVVP
ncbi:hypothetical protein M2267_002690 [Ensifer sp. KUDG1]